MCATDVVFVLNRMGRAIYVSWLPVVRERHVKLTCRRGSVRRSVERGYRRITLLASAQIQFSANSLHELGAPC